MSNNSHSIKGKVPGKTLACDFKKHEPLFIVPMMHHVDLDMNPVMCHHFCKISGQILNSFQSPYLTPS